MFEVNGMILLKLFGYLIDLFCEDDEGVSKEVFEMLFVEVGIDFSQKSYS